MGLKKRYSSPFFILLFLLAACSTWASTDKYRCMWQEDPSTSMVIAWNQISGTNPILYFDEFDGGKDIALYANSQKPDHFSTFKGMNNTFVYLKGLHPGTVYYFIIVDSDSVSRRMSFRTAPNHAHERLSIIAGGDSRNYRSARRRANILVAKLQPHCVMFGGDMTGGDTNKEWREWMDDWQHTITPEGKLTPIIATRGNHEYSNRTITELFQVPHPEVFYTLSLGGNLLQIYTLNSLIATGGNQKAWLQKELEQSDHTWKVAQYHFGMRPHTLRKTDRNTQMNNWASLFFEHHVNLVVESDAHVVKTTWPIRPSRGSGNDEGFVRDDENGTVYVGEGCWGAPLRRNNDNKRWTRNSGSFNQFKWIFVDRDRIEVRTVKTDNAEEVATVSPYDIFNPPAGIDIWNPSNGPVLTIYPRGQAGFPLALNNPASRDAQTWTASNNKVIGASSSAKRSPAVSVVEVSDFRIEGELGKNVHLLWQSKGENDRRLKYELQRSVDGKNFQTIAQVQAQGAGGGQYRIADTGQLNPETPQVQYRLKYRSGGQIQTKEISQKIAPPKVKNPWRAFPELIPDKVSGQVKVKYHLAEETTVQIQLLNSEGKQVSVSDYPKQRAGNYLRTIDLAIFPKDLYLLIIKVNEDQVSQYQIVWR